MSLCLHFTLVTHYQTKGYKNLGLLYQGGRNSSGHKRWIFVDTFHEFWWTFLSTRIPLFGWNFVDIFWVNSCQHFWWILIDTFYKASTVRAPLFFTQFFTGVYIVERLLLQTTYVLNKEILQLLDLRSMGYKSARTVFPNLSNLT